jgi:hypothetical protein
MTGLLGLLDGFRFALRYDDGEPAWVDGDVVLSTGFDEVELSEEDGE